MFERYKVIHFVGIGGIGMSGIAEVLYNLGYVVTGSDVKASQTTERLAGLGMRIAIGHKAANVEGAHVVVISSAVRADNPEVVAARKAGTPVIPRAEMLAELGRLKYAVLVAGSHGKTTTTSLVSTVLAHAGFDPTVVIGGRLNALGTNARLGRGQFMVAEADESDGSFLKLNPTMGVVTNIDLEHMEHFKTEQALMDAFLLYMNKVPFYGATVACIDDRRVRELLPHVHRKTITYGLGKDAELQAKRLRSEGLTMNFEARLRGESIGRFTVPLSGEHNVLNTLAAIAVAMELQIPIDSVREALAGFGGIQRRLELKGEGRGVRVYDDYGHHPTEVRATLKAARKGLVAKGKLIVVFQPHRYTRTRDLMSEFAESFKDADKLVMLDIYAAGEEPIEGISTQALLARMRGDVVHAKSLKDAADIVAREAAEGDMVLTLGAGDVSKVCDKILKTLKG